MRSYVAVTILASVHALRSHDVPKEGSLDLAKSCIQCLYVGRHWCELKNKPSQYKCSEKRLPLSEIKPKNKDQPQKLKDGDCKFGGKIGITHKSFNECKSEFNKNYGAEWTKR
jgi:hypothetical protein